MIGWQSVDDTAVTHPPFSFPDYDDAASVWRENAITELVSVVLLQRQRIEALRLRETSLEAQVAVLERELELARSAQPEPAENPASATLTFPMKVKREVPGRGVGKAKAGFYLFGADQEEIE